MPQLRSQKILGLAITEQAIFLAEVHATGPRRTVHRLAEFPYPEGSSATNLTAIGRPLAQFLRKHGFSTRYAVVGLPARWVLIKPKEVPPADANAAAGILRLQAETDFSSDVKDLCYDYAGQPSRSSATNVLLMAVPQSRLTQITEMADSAGLGIEAITPSVAALGSASRTLVAPEGLVLYLAGKSTEIAVQSGSGLHRIRHVGGMTDAAITGAPAAASGAPAVAGGGASNQLVSEIRRTFATLPQNGTPVSDRKLIIWDAGDLGETGRRLIGERLGIPVDLQELSGLGVTDQSAAVDAARFAPAVALATAALDAALPVDFAHSRLAPPKVSTLRRKVVIGSIIAGVVLLAAGALVYDTKRIEYQTDRINTDIKNIAPEAANLSLLDQHVKYVNAWRANSLKYLNCVQHVNDAIPTDGSVWVMDIQLDGEFKGKIDFKTINQNIADQVLANLSRNSKYFANVKFVGSGSENRAANPGVGRNFNPNVNTPGGEVSYSLTFTYIGKD